MSKNKNNCIFYDKYFLDDLENYKITNNNGIANIKYYDSYGKEQNYPITLSPDISSVLTQGFFETGEPEEDLWYPIFIDKINNKVKNKFLFRGSAATNLVLGIDKCFSFQGKFKNWTIAGSSKMSLDWIINSQLPAYLTEYGLMCWVQKSKLKAKSIPIDQVPVGACVRYAGALSYKKRIDNIDKIIQINSTHYLVKINTNTLKIFNNEESIFQADTFNFLSKDKIFSIDDYLNINFPKNSSETDELYNTRIENIRKNTLIFYADIESQPGQSPINIIDPDTVIYLPKGDVYSYYEDTETRAILGLPSLTYISSTIYQEYREVFNLLTVDLKKEKKSELNQAQYRLLQKVAKFIASHPLVDRTTISVLLSDEAKTLVKNFTDSIFASVEMEMNATKIVLRSLSKLFKDLSIRVKNDYNLSGYCFNQADLVKNLMAKYETYLDIDIPTTISYKPGLKYGPHVRVNQNLVSKTNINAKNTILYNNFKATIGPYLLESVINQQQTYFSFKDTTSRGPNSKLSIPLWDIKKKNLLNSKLQVSAGPDFIIKYGKNTAGTEISYPMDNNNLGNIDGQILEKEKLQILWSKISGSDCLRFSDSNLNNIRNEDGTFTGGDSNLRFEESTDPYPILYIKNIGKYILRLRITTSIGVFYDRVTVYVVNDKGEYAPGLKPKALAGATMIDIKPTDGLVVITPSLREFAVGKQGIFWPTYSDLSIYDEFTNPYGTVASFGNLLKKYKLIENKISNDPCPISFTYIPNNTNLQVSRIILSHMMDNNPDCYNCNSFFQNTLNNKGFIIDVNNSFTLENPETNSSVTFEYPAEVAVDRTQVIAYGNHKASTINDLGITIPYHPSTGTALPSVTGLEISIRDKSGNPTHLCHLKNVNNEKPVIFEKGCFHQSSGWLVDPASSNINHIEYKNNKYNDFLNKSSVINFNPERRKTFKFKGPGFFNLNNTSAEKTNIQEISNTNIYFSNIILGVAAEARDCKKVLGCTKEQIAEKEKEEIGDHQINLGYRNAAGSSTLNQAMPTDEFEVVLKVEPEGAVPSVDYCSSSDSSQNYQVNYIFNKKGSYLPKEKRTATSRFTTDISRAEIEDIEIEISFLNYVNTKNLIVWLDVTPCSYITSQLFRRQASDTQDGQSARDRWFYIRNNIHNSIYSTSYKETKSKINTMEEGPLKKYLKALFEMNDNPAPNEVSSEFIDENSDTEPKPSGIPNTTNEEEPKSSTYRLYLLNQEHIEGNRFNFSLKFTDNINKNIQSFDSNNVSENIDPLLIKSIEKDGVIHLLPTLSAFGYSDNDINFFRQIIQTNNSHTLNNRFMKFSGMPLFLDSDGDGGYGTTKFSLGIAVVNQSDTMEIIDNVAHLDPKNAITRTIDNIKPSIMNNSICCWYLILHINNNGPKRYLPSDILGNIDYSNKNPNIYGYNFISSFNNKKHLLPPININAPYSSVLDPDICKYSREALNKPTFEAIPFNILPLIFVGSAFSAVGGIALAESVDAQGDQLTREIVNFLNTLRRAQQSKTFSENLYIPKYDRYPFGGPDKALISVSADNKIWFKLEASIFKYSNCPISKRRRLGYLKLNYKTAKKLAIFNFNTVDTVEALLNTDDIKVISVPLEFVNQVSNITRGSLEKNKEILIKQIEPIKKQITALTSRATITEAQQKQIENLNKQVTELELKVSLHDETLNSIGIKIRKFNLIKIKKTITQEKTKEKPEMGYNLNIDGLYIVEENNNLLKIVDTPGLFSMNKIITQLTKSSLLDFKFTIIPNPDPDPENKKTKPFVLQNKLIKLDGLRPFYFFDKNDQIITIRPISDYLSELRKNGPSPIADQIEKEIENLKTQIDKAKQNKDENLVKSLEETLWNKENLLNNNTIVSKGYIFDGVSHKTILELALPIIGSSITIAPEHSNTVLVYDKFYSTVENNKKNPYNKWTHAETSNSVLQKNKNQEEPITSTFGEGLYGTGSLLVNPKTLPYKNIENEVQSLSEQISERNVFNKKSTLVDIYYNDTNIYKENNLIEIIGYNYTYNDAEYIKNSTQPIDMSLNKISGLFSKNPTYIQHSDFMSFINIKSDFFKTDLGMPDSGEISFDIDSNFTYPNYKLTPADIAIINPRIRLLLQKKTLQIPNCSASRNPDQCLGNYWDSISYNNLYINDLYLYLENVGYTKESNRNENKKQAQLRLQSLITELANIIYFCETGEAIITNPNEDIPIYKASNDYNLGLPIEKIEISTEQDGSLMFSYKSSNDDYWINIDPEQSCSIDYSEIPKILIETKYTCERVDDYVSLDMQNICPVSARDPDIPNGLDENFKHEGNVFIYRPSAKQLASQFSKYPDISWPTTDINTIYGSSNIYTVNRKFFINALGKERNQLVSSEEKYLLPILPDLNKIAQNTADGELLNKVRDIFNLDNAKQIYVKFKRIPRKLRKYDTSHDKYLPNYLGELTKSLIPGPGGPVDSTLQFWHCINKDGKYVDPPRYFKWLNEMIFRAYYGSTDAVEHSGRDLSESKETFDWIPYDYL